MIEVKTIKELCMVVADCPHSTPKWTSSGKIVIRSNNIKNGKINFSSPSYTDEKNFEIRTKRAMPRGGDLIITREAPMGESWDGSGKYGMLSRTKNGFTSSKSRGV